MVMDPLGTEGAVSNAVAVIDVIFVAAVGDAVAVSAVSAVGAESAVSAVVAVSAVDAVGDAVALNAVVAVRDDPLPHFPAAETVHYHASDDSCLRHFLPLHPRLFQRHEPHHHHHHRHHHRRP